MTDSSDLRAELDRIASFVVDRAVYIHKRLGPGLLESAYVRILLYELRKAGFKAESEVEVPLIWDEQELGAAFRADIVVEDKFIIEVKATDGKSDLFARQLLTYLILKDCRLGLVINFGARLVKNGIERVANNF